MKYLCFITLCLMICCLLNAVEVQNIQASAISDAGFTASWDSIAGATGYELEIQEGTHFFNDFESISTFPEGWDIQDARIYEYQSYAYSGSCFGVIRDVEAYVRTPLLNNPGSLTFYARAPARNSVFEVRVQISSNGNYWDDIEQLNAVENDMGNVGSSHRKYHFEINQSGTYYLRLFMPSILRGGFYFDDLQYTELSSSNQSKIYTTIYPAFRFVNLSEQEDYIYKVKPIIQDGDFSYYNGLETTAYEASVAMGSAIWDNPAELSLSTDFGVSTHIINITPSNMGLYDYSAEIEEMQGVFHYTVHSDSTTALMGNYSITHMNLTANGIEVFGAEIANVIFSSGTTTFTLNEMNTKGSVEIILETIETLPVFLNRFEVTHTTSKLCRLSWQSATETMLAGYYVFRSIDNNLSNAQQVSGLIPAVNSSTPQMYIFTDSLPIFPAYYWLQALSYGGEEQSFGPLIAEYHTESNAPQEVMRSSLTLFPNPFEIDTQLSVSLAKNDDLNYKIYNTRGQLINSGCLGMLAKDTTQKNLRITDRNGNKLSSGVYLLHVGGSNFHCVKSFIILR